MYGNQITTLNLQISYDTKLNNATYDALKTFQINTINSETSDLANSKISDIEASVSMFFRSISNNFNMAGYNQDILKEYVPALVYTMYDGYYIYSPYTNTLDDTNEKQDENGETGSDATILNANNPDATYKQGDRISGLKPYIYYSCRYKKNDDNDFIINYSLDNYITIQGLIKGKWVYDYGYLLDNITERNTNIKYRGVEIEANEALEEIVCIPETAEIKKCPSIKINGVKYYKDTDTNEWFSIMGDKKIVQRENFKEQTNAAIKYYEDAYDFTKRVIDEYDLGDLTGQDAVDENTGESLYEKDEDGNNINGMYKFGNYSIFETNSRTSIEDPQSNFNQQRLAVIRYAIEKNLSIAINNYNNYTSSTTNFQMPKLKEDEWSNIINNVSIISFLQGLNIGGKIYNGYSIVTNDKSQEVVAEDSIYIITNDNQYHRANDIDLQGNSNIKMGALNLDFEIKTVVTENEGAKNFIPRR